MRSQLKPIAAKNTAPTEQPILPRFIFGFAVARSPGKGQSRHIQKTSKTALFRSTEKTLKIPPVSKPKNAKFNTNFHIDIFARENTVYVIYVDNFFWIVDNSPVLPKVIHIYPQKRMFVWIVRLSENRDYIWRSVKCRARIFPSSVYDMFWKNILFVLSFAFYKNQIVQKSAKKYDCSNRFRKQKNNRQR